MSDERARCPPPFTHRDPKKWVNPKKERKRRREAEEAGEPRRSKKKGPGAADAAAEEQEEDAEALEDKYLKAYAERGAKKWAKKVRCNLLSVVFRLAIAAIFAIKKIRALRQQAR